MTLEQGFFAHLTETAAPVGSALAEVQEQLGGLWGGARVYSMRLREGLTVWPALTVQRIGDGRRPWSHNGPTGLAETRLQLDVWARDSETSGAKAVIKLADSLRRALDGFVGQWGSVTVRKVMLDSERDDYDPDIAARLWRRSQDYLVWHEETT